MTQPQTVAVLHGIPNCDTVKRARAWLTEHGVAHEFHDFKKAGVPEVRLAAWLASAGWERLLNRKGTMWRKLDEADRIAVVDAASAAALMRRQPSVIKRPVVDWPDGRTTVGFEAAEFARHS
jgi:Spx/MgsR family transcriptional regulator